MNARRVRSTPRLLAVVATTTVTLLLIAGAVFGLGDRTVLVPAPEAVGEGLLRQLATHRSHQTAQYLSDAARQALPPRQLRAWFEGIERRVGSVLTIEGERSVMRGDTAEAFVRIRGDLDTVSLRLPMLRLRGQWMVSGLPSSSIPASP